MFLQRRNFFRALEEIRGRRFGLWQVDDRLARAMDVALVGFGLAIEHSELRSEDGAAFQHGIENGIEMLLQNRRPDLVEELGSAAGLAEVVATAFQRSVENGMQRRVVADRRRGDVSPALKQDWQAAVASDVRAALV